jgi:hypothetical protein
MEQGFGIHDIRMMLESLMRYQFSGLKGFT